MNKYVDIESQENELLKSYFKTLLWNIGNQREKIGSNLSTILPILYPNYNEEQIYNIKKKILDNIK